MENKIRTLLAAGMVVLVMLVSAHTVEASVASWNASGDENTVNLWLDMVYGDSLAYSSTGEVCN